MKNKSQSRRVGNKERRLNTKFRMGVAKARKKEDEEAARRRRQRKQFIDQSGTLIFKTGPSLLFYLIVLLCILFAIHDLLLYCPGEPFTATFCQGKPLATLGTDWLLSLRLTWLQLLVLQTFKKTCPDTMYRNGLETAYISRPTE